ncbi:hypothetical protein [Extensimonas perlucida]|uniref:hypothetical protein n=1 Tax=Extensimonas perlucida TaxID=2590786 RepID=UPI00119FB6C8|nr:hypothetical protein [Extensimonas perlucida]
MTIEALAIEKVSSRFGAPHGRPEEPLRNEPRSVHLFRVPLDSGGYDQGGAYWGHGTPIYCFAQPPEQGQPCPRKFVRAHSRIEACLEAEMPAALLLRPPTAEAKALAQKADAQTVQRLRELGFLGDKPTP